MENKERDKKKAELKKELEAILQQEQQEAQEIWRKRQEVLLENAYGLLPFLEHKRGGCSDRDLSPYDGCYRCVVKDAIESGCWPDNWDVEVYLKKRS